MSKQKTPDPDPEAGSTEPVKAPNNPRHDRTARENDYSPDFKSDPEKKPNRDADIDTDGG